MDRVNHQIFLFRGLMASLGRVGSRPRWRPALLSGSAGLLLVLALAALRPGPASGETGSPSGMVGSPAFRPSGGSPSSSMSIEPAKAGTPSGGAAAVPPAWEQHPGYRVARLPVPAAGKTGFTLLTPEQTGITYSNLLDEARGTANRILQNGSGLAVGDYDNDGRPDIFFCGVDSTNRLYRNLGNLEVPGRDRRSRAGLDQQGQPRRGVCRHQRRRLARFALLLHRAGGWFAA